MSADLASGTLLSILTAASMIGTGTAKRGETLQHRTPPFTHLVENCLPCRFPNMMLATEILFRIGFGSPP